MWGILGILFTEKLHPFVRKKVEKVSSLISKKTQKFVIYTLVVIFVIDEIFSIISHLS